MTLATTSTTTTQTATGMNSTFPFAFEIFEATDLVVTSAYNGVTSGPLILNSDYSVSMVGSPSNGGSITMLAGNPPAGTSVTISRVLPLTQEVALASQGTFRAEDIENEFDRLVMQDQQINTLLTSLAATIASIQALQSGAATLTALFTATVSGTTMTVSAISAGILTAGMVVSGGGLPANTIISAPGTGTGGTGTYILNNSATIGSPTALTASGSGALATIGILNALASAASGFGDALVAVQRSVGGSVAATQHQVNEAREFDLVADFGCPTSGTVDCSSYVTTALANVPSGSTLRLPPGLFKMNVVWNKFVHLKGAGQTATQIQSYTAGGVAIQYVNFSGIGLDNLLHIQHLTFTGATSATTDIGLQFGHTVYQSGDENAGWVHLDHVTFIYLNICINRLYGNLVVVATHCNFLTANYHTWAQSYTNMHAGCFLAKSCNFEYANLASQYLNSSYQGSGQVLYDTCIFENNPGFLWFVAAFNNTGDAGFAVKNCWNEVNYTAGSVTIGTYTGAPAMCLFGLSGNTTPITGIEFENTQVGPMILNNAHVRVRRCAVDRMVPGNGVSQSAAPTLDSSSTMLLDDIQMFYGQVNMVPARSLLWASSSYACASRVKHRTWITKGGHNSTNVLKNPCTAPFTTTGTVVTSANVSTDGVLFNPCQSLAVPASGTLADPTTFTVTTGKFYVWILTYKLVSGTMPQLYWPGGAPFTVMAPSSSEWVTLAGILKSPITGVIGLNIAGNGNTSTIYLGGHCMLEFNTMQEAFQFLESGAFPS